MAGFLVYHMPGTCSQVVLTALEETGCTYEERTVNLMAGSQYSPQFQALNPKGKVPVLVKDGAVITELPAIVFRLASLFPQARLLPRMRDDEPSIDCLSDLIWAAGTVQPLVSRLFRPDSVAPSCIDEVRQTSLLLLAGHAHAITSRVGDGWWYGETWSIVDTFLVWVFRIAGGLGFPTTQFPELQSYSARVEDRSAYRRTVEVEQRAMSRDKLVMPSSLEAHTH